MNRQLLRDARFAEELEEAFYSGDIDIRDAMEKIDELFARASYQPRNEAEQVALGKIYSAHGSIVADLH